MDWTRFDWLIDAALEEDAARCDATTAALVPPDRAVSAQLRAKQPGVICALPLGERVCVRFDDAIEFAPSAEDGDRVEPGQVVACLSGPAGAILSVERTMLNFLQQLSGVATLTAQFVAAVDGTGAAIYDTRKTTPGWRELQKYAVRCGGGVNHRMSLGDMVMIKDNHLALMAGVGGITEGVRLAREASPGLRVEVEVDTFEQLQEALAAAPDVIMLDNRAPERVREAVALADRHAVQPRPLLEVSGGVDLQTVRAYAEAGADIISVGALTHSAPALDLSLAFLPD